MPLSKIQSEVLRLLATHRDPESNVGGATPLNDAAVLEGAGYKVAWLRQLPVIYTAAVTKGDDGTRLEWVVDSDFRFFPTMPDELFGYVLHPVDLAMNKVMAAAVWAAVEKSPGFTPEGLPRAGSIFLSDNFRFSLLLLVVSVLLPAYCQKGISGRGSMVT